MSIFQPSPQTDTCKKQLHEARQFSREHGDAAQEAALILGGPPAQCRCLSMLSDIAPQDMIET
jgi:hypothetical protein